MCLWVSAVLVIIGTLSVAGLFLWMWIRTNEHIERIDHNQREEDKAG